MMSKITGHECQKRVLSRGGRCQIFPFGAQKLPGNYPSSIPYLSLKYPLIRVTASGDHSLVSFKEEITKREYSPKREQSAHAEPVTSGTRAVTTMRHNGPKGNMNRDTRDMVIGGHKGTGRAGRLGPVPRGGSYS
jgi:hypothetical protein